MQTNTRTLIAANLLGLAAVLIVNYLAVSLPLFGKSTAQLSDQYTNLFVPAGITFSIWGVIYSWLLVWAGVQIAALFSPAMMTRIGPGVQKLGWTFLATCLYNIAWLFCWHLELVGLSIVGMLYLLTGIMQLNRRAGVGQFSEGRWEKWLAHAPFGIYQGWITIALIANVTAFLVAIRWSGWGVGESVWAVIMIVTGTLLACVMVWRQNNVFHGLAVAWALFGIYLKRNAAGDAPDVSTAAMAGMTLVLLFVVLRSRRWLAY